MEHSNYSKFHQSSPNIHKSNIKLEKAKELFFITIWRSEQAKETLNLFFIGEKLLIRIISRKFDDTQTDYRGRRNFNMCAVSAYLSQRH